MAHRSHWLKCADGAHNQVSSRWGNLSVWTPHRKARLHRVERGECRLSGRLGHEWPPMSKAHGG